MAIVPVAPAVLGLPASSAENNKIINNVIDVDARTTSNTGIITHGTSGNAALNTRVTSLESGGVVGLKKAIYPSQNTALTASASVETDIPKLQILNLSVTNGVLYRFNYWLNLASSVATQDFFEIRLRRTNALVGPQVSSTPHFTTGNNTMSRLATFYWVATSTGLQSFFVSFIRIGGTGNLQVSQTADYRNYVEAFHVGVPGGGVIETPA